MEIIFWIDSFSILRSWVAVFFFIAVVAVSALIRYSYTLLGISIGLASLISSWVLKQLVFTEALRPMAWFEARGFDISTFHTIQGVEINLHFSFPSGHSLSAFALFGFLSIIYNRSLPGIVYFILAALVGISRIYLKQHFFEDVYTGMIIGSLICFGMHRLFNRLSLPSWTESSILNTRR